MKKRISIMVIMIAIMVLAGFTYYGSMERPIGKPIVLS